MTLDEIKGKCDDDDNNDDDDTDNEKPSFF